MNVAKWLLGLLAVAVVMPCCARGDAASDLLEKGVYQEEVAGDLTKAIEIYQQVIADAESSRTCVAEALYRKATCHLRKDEPDPARAALRQLARQYPDQAELVERARQLLDEQLRLDPAALMPPGTLLYVEVGNPGRQVETLAAMLAGTPFANPPAALQGGAPATGSSQKSPADVFAALLNPSMIEEFKKVRGLAIGITGFGQRGSQPAVAVLQPGESDALRGMIQAAIQMAGQPVEPIEGMTAVNIEGQAACAFDDTVFLIASPPEQLTECVRRYKGLAAGDSLAGTNPAFAAQAGAENRHRDALTVWVNPAKVYELVRQAGVDSSRVQAIGALVDLPSVQGLLMRGVLDPRQPHVSASGFLQPDHRCIAYQAVRTPPLTAEGFRGVPSDAVAVAAVALSAENQAPLSALGSMTGLDLGRELFANLQQVCLMALPADADANQLPVAREGHPLLVNLGLTLTSHDPQRTLSLLEGLLGLADAVQRTGAAAGPATPDASGIRRYVVAKLRGGPVECFLGQHGNVTVLALNPSVAQQCLQACTSGHSALDEGPLAAGLAALPPQTSKLVLVNAGQALAVLDKQLGLTAQTATTQPAGGVPPLEQLAGELGQTLLCLHTQEDVNRLDAYLGIQNLPAMGKLLPLVMAQIQASGPRRTTRLKAQVSVESTPAATAAKLWNAAAGNWNEPGNWNPAGIPAGSDEVNIRGDAAAPTIPAGYTATVGRVYVYYTGTNTLTIAAGGTLNVGGPSSFLKIGFGKDADGVGIQEGDLVLDDGADMIIGDGSNTHDTSADGYYYLRSGTIAADEILLGFRGGNGRMYQSGGLVNSSAAIIGESTGSTGLYAITGGSLVTGRLKIAKGTFEVGSSAAVGLRGPLTINSGGVLTVHLASPSDYGKLQDIAGTVVLANGCKLDVQLTGDYVPQPELEYTILSVAPGYAIDGTFTNIPAGWAVELRDSNRRLVLRRI